MHNCTLSTMIVLDMEKDRWIVSNSRIEAKKLHALGVVTLNWNTAEFSLFWLFCTVSGLSGITAKIIAHDMSIPLLQNKVKNFLSKDSFISDTGRELVSHGLKSFDICRINRNQLTHFMPSQTKNGMEFFRNTGPTFNDSTFPSNLESLRRVADEIRQTSSFITSVSNHIAEAKHDLLSTPTVSLLPKKIPLPQRLWSPLNPQQSKGRDKKGE